MIPPPAWFERAHKTQSCEELWATVAYEAFDRFSHNQDAQPWHPDTCCWGNFWPGFDEQPGIPGARLRCIDLLFDDERRRVLERLAERGIDIFELGELMVYQANVSPPGEQ